MRRPTHRAISVLSCRFDEFDEHATGGVYSVKGREFSRDSRYIQTRIVAEPRPGTDDYPVEPGRYRLVVARACPWNQRSATSFPAVMIQCMT